MLPKVSVHLPSYQQREFLREAIESVLVQDYPDFEIVVGDDGSTDGTHEMLREYDARYPGRFRLALATENRGTTANWNQILALCTGEFIAWLDGDDLMLPGRLRTQAEWLLAHPEAVICYGNEELFDHNTGRTTRLLHTPRHNRFRTSRGPTELLRSATFIGTSSVMGRRSALPEGGADSRIKFITDWLLWFEMAQHGDIGYVTDVVTRYRVHGNNITRRNDLILFDQILALGLAEAKYPQYIGKTRPMRAETLWGHALGCLRQERYERAEMLFRRSFAEAFRTYNVATPYKVFIWALIRLGKLDRAVPWYEKALRIKGRLAGRGGRPGGPVAEQAH